MNTLTPKLKPTNLIIFQVTAINIKMDELCNCSFILPVVTFLLY